MSLIFNSFEIAKLSGMVHGNVTFSLRHFLTEMGVPSSDIKMGHAINDKGMKINVVLLTPEEWKIYAMRRHSYNRDRMLDHLRYKSTVGSDVYNYLSGVQNGTSGEEAVISTVSKLSCIAAVDKAIEELNRVRETLLSTTNGN